VPRTPVILDPLQTIISVHWRKKIVGTFRVAIEHTVFSTGGSTCSPIVGSANRSEWSRIYINQIRFAPSNGYPFDGQIVNFNGTSCICSGFPAATNGNIEPWAYAFQATDPIGIRSFEQVGATGVGMVISGIDRLDGTPSCMGWGIFAQANISTRRVGAGELHSGTIFDYAGAILTENGGEGRVFRAASVSVSTFSEGNGAIGLIDIGFQKG
jgi:hypothetical protein